MSLTDNFDKKTGKEWQATNIACMVIGYDKALEFVQEQIEALEATLDAVFPDEPRHQMAAEDSRPAKRSSETALDVELDELMGRLGNLQHSEPDEQITKFVEVIGCNHDEAKFYLESAEFNVERAVEVLSLIHI